MTIKQFEQLYHDKKCIGTSMPHDYVPKTKFSDKTSNEFATLISAFIEYHNQFSTRMSVEGRLWEGKKFKDVLGQTRQLPNKRLPASNLKGSFDVTNCVFSVRLEVEIKIKKDKVRPDQIKFAERIKKAGGVAIVVHNWEEFYDLWVRFIKYLPTHFETMKLKVENFIVDNKY